MKSIAIPLTFCCFFIFLFSLNAQTTKLGKDQIIYLTINDNETYFKTSKNRDKRNYLPIKDYTINNKGNSIDIYLNWINPLQYKLVIQDSIINDVRIEEIKKFYSESFTGALGGVLKPGNTKASDFFNNECLKGDLKDINTYQASLQSQIKSLYEESDYNNAKEGIESANELISCFEKNERMIIAGLYILKNSITKLEDVNEKEKELQSYSEYDKNFESSKKLVMLLKVYILQLENSFKEKEASDFLENHFFSKNIVIPKSKSVKLVIQLSKKELKDDYSIADTKNILKTHTILVQRYDFITPKVATGIFYSSVTLNGFGVTTNESDELIVTQNNIEKDKAVTGVFLNLNFNIGSQFLEPFLQIGVDPTKEKPYLLVGAGFSIPSSNFSISGGPIWTWEPTLNKLALGDTVISTSVLESDIEHKFRTAPRGFYLGINYSF